MIGNDWFKFKKKTNGLFLPGLKESCTLQGGIMETTELHCFLIESNSWDYISNWEQSLPHHLECCPECTYCFIVVLSPSFSWRCRLLLGVIAKDNSSLPIPWQHITTRVENECPWVIPWWKDQGWSSSDVHRLFTVWTVTVLLQKWTELETWFILFFLSCLSSRGWLWFVDTSTAVLAERLVQSELLSLTRAVS